MSSSQKEEFTPDQVKKWKSLQYAKEKGDRISYLNYGEAIDEDHQRWLALQARTEGSATAAEAHSYHPSSSTTGFGRTPAGSAQPWSSEGDQSEASMAPSDSSVASDEMQMSMVEIQSTAMIRREDLRCDLQMHSPRKGWQPLKGIIDTGAEENWISKEVVDRLKLPVKYGLARTTENLLACDGRPISSDANVEATWCIDGQSKTHVTVFRVMDSENTPFEVLIGVNLWTSGAIDFQSKNNPIQVLVAPKEEKKELAEIAQNEAANQTQRAQLAPRPKNTSSERTKSSGKSSRTRNKITRP